VVQEFWTIDCILPEQSICAARVFICNSRPGVDWPYNEMGFFPRGLQVGNREAIGLFVIYFSYYVAFSLDHKILTKKKSMVALMTIKKFEEW
jgi:hypothetical protein